MPRVSFAEVETREFEPLPKGRHSAKLSSAEYVPESKRSGEPGIAWEFAIEEDDYRGRKGFLNTSLQKQSLWATQRVLVALGMDKKAIDALDWDTDDPATIQDTLNGLVGSDCVIVVRHEKYEGVDRQRIARVLASDEAEASKLPF